MTDEALGTLKEIRPWIPKQKMSELFSVLELNEVAYMFLTLASTIIFHQFGSFITSPFIYSNSIY